MEYCIVYISSVTDLLSEEELTCIMQRSQLKNRVLGITGIMLYFNGSVIEVLEGPENKVKALYETIRKDPRHVQATQLYANSIAHRSFPDWYMGYKTLTGLEFDHLKDILPLPGDTQPDDVEEENIIYKLVQIFYKTNYRN